MYRKSRFAIVTLILSVFFLSSCAPRNLQEAEDLSPHELLKNAAFLSELEELTKRTMERHVYIDGPSRIILPRTSASDNQTNVSTYTFYVRVDMALSEIPLAQAIASGEVEIEVLGASANREMVRYGHSDKNESTNDSQLSKSVVRLTIDSRSIERNVTIIAWRKEKYGEFDKKRWQKIEELQKELVVLPDSKSVESEKKKLVKRLEWWVYRPNPWGEIREVPVFGGDLHTQVLLLSETEATDAFGKHFSKHFYVGRVYLFNRHPDKKLVVNTTSLSVVV